MFTLDQLQIRFLKAQAMNGWARWLREHLDLSFRRLLTEHSLGVVVLGGRAEWRQEFRFFDADVVEKRVGLKVVSGGKLLQITSETWAGDKMVAHTLGVMRPVALGGGGTFAALPQNISGELLSRFQEDEVEEAKPARPILELLDTAEKGEKFIEAEVPLVVHRHYCEVADQWSYIDIGGHIQAAREKLCLEHRKETPKAGSGLGASLESLTLELSSPLYVYDRATISSAGYDVDGKIMFVHRITSDTGSDRPHATGVEVI